MSQKKYWDLLPVIVARVGAVLPPGFDSWGLKSVHPDLTTTYDFKWTLPGGRSRSDDAVVATNKSECPFRPGDGLCIATTWEGMASGGIPARTMLLVAYRSEDILGRSAGKLRVSCEVAVIALVDGERLLREAGSGADLSGADLRYADLTGADLSGADLRYADLTGANLRDADLRGADLRHAELSAAKLYGADLYGADLRYTELAGAKLHGASLRYADLRDANLRYAELAGADLSGANLCGADLFGANLCGANMSGANLSRAGLYRADLYGANMRYADLRHADLYSADLTDADLSSAVNVKLPDRWALNKHGVAVRSNEVE